MEQNGCPPHHSTKLDAGKHTNDVGYVIKYEVYR